MNRNKKIYLITYSTDTDFDNNILRQRMNVSFKRKIYLRLVVLCRQHLFSCLYIKYNMLYDSIYSAINRNFLIAEIKPKNTHGWLPKEAWDWINKHIHF